MNATVIATSRSSALFVVRLEDGDHLVLELLSGDVSLGHKLSSADLDELGSINAMNASSGNHLSLFGQTGRTSFQAAIDLLRRS